MDDPNFFDQSPIIANEENKALDLSVKQKQRKIQNLELLIDDQNERIKTLESHLSNMRQEIQLSEALFEARKRECSSQQHLATLASKEETRFQKDKTAFEQQMETLNNTINSNENNIVRWNKQVMDITEKMQWNKQQLDEWMSQTKELDADAELIDKYTRQDNAHIKQLTLTIDTLTTARDKAQQQLEHAAMQTQEARVSLDRLASEFQRVFEQHQQTTESWQKVIAQMEVRDEEITKEAENHQQIRSETNRMINILRSKSDDLELEKRNNKEVSDEIQSAERQSTLLQTEVATAEQDLESLQTEMAAIKTSLSSTATQVQNARRKLESINQARDEKLRRAEKIEKSIAESEETLEHAEEKQLNAVDQTRQLEQMLAQDEKEYKLIQDQLASLRKQALQADHRVQQLRQSQNGLKSQLSSLKSGRRGMAAKGRELRQELGQQEQQLYRLDYDSTKLNQQLDNLQGKRSKEEKEQFDKQIGQLNDRLEVQQKATKLLEQQITRVETDLRHCHRIFSQNKAKVEELETKVQEIELKNTAAEKELVQVTDEKHNLLVEQNLLKLQVHRLRNALTKRADKVLSLEEKRGEKLRARDQSMEELKLHEEMLQAQMKDAQSDCSKANKEWKERVSRIDQLRKRYEIIVMSTESNENGELKSHAYYIVQAAQQREALQRQGDELDAKIQKGERELRALENTLSLMLGQNSTMRSTLTGKSPTANKSKLEAQYQSIVEQHKQKKVDCQRLRKHVEKLSKELSQLMSQKLSAATDVRKVRTALSTQQEAFEQQIQKLQRAQKQSAMLHRQRAELDPHQAELEHLHATLDHLNQSFSSIFDQVQNITDVESTASMKFKMLLSQVGLEPPRRSRLSTRPRNGSDSQSSRSSRQSSIASRPRGSASRTTRENIQERKGRAVATKTLEISLPTIDTSPSPQRKSSSSQSQRSSRPTSGRSVKSVRSRLSNKS